MFLVISRSLCLILSRCVHQNSLLMAAVCKKMGKGGSHNIGVAPLTQVSLGHILGFNEVHFQNPCWLLQPSQHPRHYLQSHLHGTMVTCYMKNMLTRCAQC